MPIYEYACPKCGEFEHRQSLSDPVLSKCPTCRSKVTKLISSSAFTLKGGGWYADGYGKKASTAASGSDGYDKKPSTPAAGSGGSDGGGSSSGSD